MNDLVQAVRAHALKHYDEKSWSYIVEAFSDEEILEEIKGAKTPQGAINKMGKWVNMHFSYAEDIRNA